MRLVNALVTFIGAMVVQFLALAITETVLGGMITFISRNALLVVMLGVAVAAAVGRFLSSRPATPRVGGSAESPGSARRPGSSAGARAFGSADAPGAGAASAAASAAPQRPSPSSDPLKQPNLDLSAAMAATLAAVQAKQGQASPPARAPVAAMIAAASRQAVVFRQYFPPPHHPAIRSFYGGAPIAPRGFVWPRFGGDDKPLHFLLQVDCAEVPAHARLGALPDRGVLYYFLHLGTDGPVAARVIHDEARDDDWVEAAPPADLEPAFGKEATYAWPWAQTPAQCPVLLPKWPFEPVAIELPEREPEELEEDDEVPPVLWHDAPAELQAAQGEIVGSNYFTIRDVVANRSLIRPFEAFPHDWRAVQICSAMLVRDAERGLRFPSMVHLGDLAPEARDARLREIQAEAQSWFDRSLREPAFEAVPRSDRDAFWDFLVRNTLLAKSMLVQGIVLSIESSLADSAQAAARVPAEIAARVHSRHALAVTTESRLHTNIPNRMLAPPRDVQGNQWERAKTHLLLLEVSSNEGLGHHFGEGVHQIWITPEDFAAGRFDRIELTSDAY